MTNLREAAQMALDALEQIHRDNMTTIAEENWSKAIEALRAALANEFNPDWNQVEALQESLREHMAEIQRLRARLAQPEQEPVAYLCENAVGHKYFRWKKPSSEYKPIALYTANASPQRDWQRLTDKEIKKARQEGFYLGYMCKYDMLTFAHAIETKLKEKNSV